MAYGSPRPDAEQPRRVPKRGPGKCSTVVCNHTGFIEILNLVCSPLQPGFVSKDEVSRMPIAAGLTTGLQSIYISRAADEASKKATIKTITDRASAIEDDCEPWSPFMVFPEGSTSNGSHLLKFKRGAFEAMRTVRPCYFKISDRMFWPGWDVIEFWPLFILVASSLCCYTCTIYMMPEFTPNEKMLEMHADKGSEDWEIFAECVREAMAKQSGYPISNQ